MSLKQRRQRVNSFERAAVLHNTVDRGPALALWPGHAVGRRKRVGAQDLGDCVFDNRSAVCDHYGFDGLHVCVNGRLMPSFADQMDREIGVIEERPPRRDNLRAFFQPFPKPPLGFHHADKLLGIRNQAVALHPLGLKERIKPKCFGRQPAPAYLTHRRTILVRRIKGE